MYIAWSSMKTAQGLNYSMTGLTTGMQNKEEDLDSSYFLLTCAMESLLNVEVKTEGDAEEQNVNKNNEKKDNKKSF